MSTKFSIRPAPRKRPWICKRSPPCLDPPPYPQSLLCSFWLQRIQPPPHGPTRSGSMILDWNPVLGKYYGWWISGLDSVDALFDYYPPTALATCSSNISIDASIDLATWLESVIPLPPALFYQAMVINATTYTWRGQIDITG